MTRGLSLDLGGGNCKWQPPAYEVPDSIDFKKTIIAGYLSGDKRMIFVQMEALTGWPAKDEWDFEFLGMSNHPFIKANYPHHEGHWGWGNVGDQVVMMIPNIRMSMVEYNDILWDLGCEFFSVLLSSSYSYVIGDIMLTSLLVVIQTISFIPIHRCQNVG